MKNGKPVGTATFTAYHTMQLNQLSRTGSESIQYSKATIEGDAKGIEVSATATAVGTAKASMNFPQGHVIDGPFTAGVTYSDSVGPGKVNPSRTTYRYTFNKPGYATGADVYESAYYGCDDTFKRMSASCVFRDAPGAVSMVDLPYISAGIRALRASGGHYGDPNGGPVLHALADSKQASKNRDAVCGKTAPTPAEKAQGRTWCDEYPFAATYEGGTSLPASQREITYTTPNEQQRQGGLITAFKRKYRILDHDPFYVIA
ncbi:NucA/NucB deoxyribonuclease domain-containing protein [Streptomyces hygroscopicus]|uniref:NucA/NucB deoxyribonuclease domain-containing protein n=1 Tax=Streptomyces hygroscopicus TaxID=1912 RepID=UPI00223EA613|nr:hypothetical protein [Streptomyces hygroscopicus]